MSYFIYALKKITAGLRLIDIYGRKTELTLNHEVAYKTVFGGISTLILTILSLLLFLNFGSDMMYHENPSNISSEIYSQTPEKQHFSKEEFFFMFGVEDPNYAHFIDETVYTASLKHHSLNKIDRNQSFATEIPLERCTEAHLPTNNELKQYFLTASGSPITQLFCAKNIEELFMQGSFDNEIFIYLEIVIKICDNQTNVSICKPIDEIKKKMAGFFAFYSVDYLINPQNFENPGHAIGKDYFSPISVGMTRNTNRFIESSRVSSDDGFLFISKKQYKYPTFSYDKETLLSDPTNGENLLTFAIRKAHSDHVYERSYKKIQRCLAEIGGFIQIIYLIFWTANYPLVSKKYYEKIVNLIYNFEGEKEKDNAGSLFWFVQKKCIVKSVVHPEKQLTERKTSEISRENLMKYMLKIKNHPPLKMSYFEYFKAFLLKKKREKNENKFNRLMKGKHVLEEKLDISFLLKKLYEIEKLKMILLNENQYNLFDYLPKPMILKNARIDLGNSNANLKNYESDDVINKAKNLYFSFRNIMKQSELSLIDRKLINLLDENVKTLLEVISTCEIRLTNSFFYNNNNSRTPPYLKRKK